MVSEAEWSQIKSLFDIDKEISVTRIKTDKGEFFSTDPPVCYKCFEVRNFLEPNFFIETTRIPFL